MGSTLYNDMTDMSKLQRAEALDSIDALRQASFSAGIDVPQIVICGSNPIDKDSLVGALTQLSIPLRIREHYPTEFVMRNDLDSHIHAFFRPDSSRALADVLHLQQFRYFLRSTDKSETTRMFDAASRHYDQLGSNSSYYHDMLRIEVTGPAQLPLTLIVSHPRRYTVCT